MPCAGRRFDYHRWLLSYFIITIPSFSLILIRLRGTEDVL